MIRTNEYLQRVDTEILERYFRYYKKIKKYIACATDADKQKPLYKQRKIIVGGSKKFTQHVMQPLKKHILLLMAFQLGIEVDFILLKMYQHWRVK